MKVLVGHLFKFIGRHSQLSAIYAGLSLTDALTMRLRWIRLNKQFLLKESGRLLVGMTIIILLHESFVCGRSYLSQLLQNWKAIQSPLCQSAGKNVKGLGEKQTQSGVTRTG